MTLRVVPDTNVLISALVFPGGVPEAVYRAAIEQRIRFVTSLPLLAELGRILTTKFGWNDDMCEQAVEHLVRIALVVEPTESLRVIADDPDDDRVLEAAASGTADVIVSGDRHLLALGRWREVEVLAPTDLVERLTPPGESD